MRISSNKPALVVILGPTAVGKTEISIQLAEHLSGEIISADSRLFYRGMNIGTAKPNTTELKRVPHHLIDVTDPENTWSLSLFQQAAVDSIAAIHTRGSLPILVGGTGQYINALIQGWSPPGVVPHPELRSIFETIAENHGKQWLHDRLATLDPAASASIDARNVRRTIRALEVIFTTGKRFSEQSGRTDSAYNLLRIGLSRPRPELYARIDARIDAMFAHGLMDEVETLLHAGYSPSLPCMSAIGYRECILVLQEKLSLEEAKARMRKNTRIFVRRQANWFKQDDDQICWFNVEPGCVEKIEQTIRKHYARRWNETNG